MGLLDNMQDDGGDPQMPPLQNPIGPAAQMPGPQAAQLPPMSAAPQRRPSLLERVGHALSAATGGISDAIRPSMPGGYDTLGSATPSPEEEQAARPGFLRSIFYGPNQLSPSDQYAKNLDAIVSHKMLGVQLQQQGNVMQSRRAMTQEIGPPPMTGSEQDISTWTNKALAYSMAHGDLDSVKTLQPLADQFAKNLHSRPYEPQLFKGPNGELQYFNPSETTKIPQGWQQVFKPGASGMGTPQLFRAPANAAKGSPKMVGIAPGDNEELSKYAGMGYTPEVTARTEFVQNATQNRFDVADINKQVAAFAKVNSPITKAAAMYPGFKAVAAQALAGNPAATKALTTQAAPLLDPSVQLRYQTLMYIQKIDPSFKGSVDRWLAEKGTGTLPPDQVRKVVAVVDAIRKEQRYQYENRRNDLASNFPGADKYIPSGDDVFGAEQNETPSGGAKPSVNDVEGYLKALRSKKP